MKNLIEELIEKFHRRLDIYFKEVKITTSGKDEGLEVKVLVNTEDESISTFNVALVLNCYNSNIYDGLLLPKNVKEIKVLTNSFEITIGH